MELVLKAAEVPAATALLASVGSVLERLKLRINVIDACNEGSFIHSLNDFPLTPNVIPERVCKNLDLKPLKSLRSIQCNVVPRVSLYVS
jgi:hypothetical protein